MINDWHLYAGAGYGIAKHLEQSSEGDLRVEQGSLYPALERLLAAIPERFHVEAEVSLFLGSVTMAMRIQFNSNRVAAAASMAVVISAGGCGGDRPAFDFFQQDSSGVTIVTSDLSVPEELPLCELGERSLRLGSVNGDAANVVLYGIVAARELSDGRLAVLSRGSEEVLIFTESGALDMTIGREGSGPGEFVDPIELLILQGDSIVVWDWDLNRISLFDASGSLVRTIAPDPPVAVPTGGFGALGDGFVIASHQVMQFFEGPDFTPQYLQLLAYDSRGELTDTVATLPFGSLAIVNPEANLMGSPTFEPEGMFASSGSAVYTSDGASPEVAIRGLDGRVSRLVRWRSPDRAVFRSDIETYRESRLAGLEGGFLELIRDQLDRVPTADVFPTASAVALGSQGDLWVRRYVRPSAATAEWWRFDGNGAFRCALGMPLDWTVMEFGRSSVLVVAPDDLDVEFVERWTIRGPA